MTVDVRSRVDAPRALEFDPARFLDEEFPASIEEHADDIGPALAFIRPRPLEIEVDGDTWTLVADGGRVAVERRAGSDVAARVRLGREQLADLADDQQTVMSLWAAGALDQQTGTVGHLLDWWLVLRAALDGTPIYTPGSVTLDDRDGAPLDLTRVFRPDDDRAEMRHFLETAGYLHIERLFDDAEMAAISADMDRAAPTYTEGDGRSWWARTAGGDPRLVRMQGFDNESDGARRLIEDPRFLDLASIAGAGHRFGTKRASNKIEALFKPIGVTEGISDIPWHKDCGIGRHSYDCCGLTVGISVTGADAVSGQLWVIAGSHRALVWSGIRQPDLDLPEVALPTRTGDVTLHLSCTMHMAQPPVERERRVMYSGFGLPPLATADTDALAASRARLGAVREGAPLTVLDRHFKSWDITVLEFDPLDEYPIHQVALPMRYVASSDRNVYDRCIYQGVDHEADAYFITGMGLYPNLGVMDAYATVRRGDKQWAIRTSGSRPDDKLSQEIGPYRIEVVKPFRELRLICDADAHGIGFDLVYRSEYGPISEPQHVRRQGDRILLDASRFAGVGTWEGELRVDGDTIAVTPDRFTATRDRSWGIRPVGEAEPPGRPNDFTGMWWCWIPLRFDDFALHIILEEDRDGLRNTNFAVRVFPESSGRPPEQLGWPLPEIRYASGTRNPIGASIELTNREGKKSTLEIEPLVGIALNVGCGYGADPDWTHGLWKGDGWIEGSKYDYQDPAVTGRAAFSLWDHVARVTFEGHEGYGIFEHGCIGAHAPSGFTDLTDVAK